MHIIYTAVFGMSLSDRIGFDTMSNLKNTQKNTRNIFTEKNSHFIVKLTASSFCIESNNCNGRFIILFLLDKFKKSKYLVINLYTRVYLMIYRRTINNSNCSRLLI